MSEYLPAATSVSGRHIHLHRISADDNFREVVVAALAPSNAQRLGNEVLYISSMAIIYVENDQGHFECGNDPVKRATDIKDGTILVDGDCPSISLDI